MDRDKPFGLEPHVERINSIFGHQTLEEIFDSLREDGSEWATTQLATLNKMVSRVDECNTQISIQPVCCSDLFCQHCGFMGIKIKGIVTVEGSGTTSTRSVTERVISMTYKTVFVIMQYNGLETRNVI